MSDHYHRGFGYHLHLVLAIFKKNLLEFIRYPMELIFTFFMPFVFLLPTYFLIRSFAPDGSSVGLASWIGSSDFFGFFMIGFPGETLEEMKMTVDFMVSSKLHTIALFVVMPFEGTELGAMTHEMGKVPVSDFSMSYHTEEFVNLTDVPSEEVNRIRRLALLKFYLNPLRLYVLARDFPNKRELGKLGLLFLRRLRWRSL